MDINRFNKNVKEMQHDILGTAYGLKRPGASWWSRNYIKVFLYSFMLLALVTCYLCGWAWPFRIVAVFIIISVVSLIWRATKKAWTIYTTYRAAKKLLKQASALKRE